MRRRLTRAEVRAFAARWQLVNAAARDELRATPPSVKLRQLAALMASGSQLGWSEALAEGVAEVRARWQRLREAYRA